MLSFESDYTGRLLGIQFDTLFTNELYFHISRHAIEMAELLKQGFHRRGYSFYLESPTNQQFLILEQSTLDQLKKEVAFGFWKKLDDVHTVVRFATSWATKQEDIGKLREIHGHAGAPNECKAICPGP